MIRRKNDAIKSGESFENGILFHSESHPGFIALAVQRNDKIQTKWTTYEKYFCNYKMEEYFNINLFSFYIQNCFLIVLSLLIMANFTIIIGIRFFGIGLSTIAMNYFVAEIMIQEKKGRTRYKKYHSAEHMTIKAYNNLKRLPTVEEIRKYSRYSNTCGTNVIMQLIVLGLFILMGSFIQNILAYFIIILVIIYIMTRCGLMNFLQIYTTDIPTEREIKLAIECLKVWIDNEEK